MRPRGVVALLGAAVLQAACAGSSPTGTSAAAATPAANVMAVQVNAGPTRQLVNGLFASVTICVPNTSNCQTIDNVEVDTGSEGLRLLSSQVTLPLPRITDGSGNQVGNCTTFVDLSYIWGPMVRADVTLGGESAASVPIQLIGVPGFPDAPTVCSQVGTAGDTLASLGANGLLGIGFFRQDCGRACTGVLPSLPALYYTCPGGTCSVTPMAIADQLQNPVWLFPQDNNGLLIQLPAVPATGAPSVSGSLIFGIGTRTNNGLGSAHVYTTDGNGTFTTTFQGATYPGSYLDTGSNGLFFLDASTIGIPACADGNSDFSCPPTTGPYTAANTGANGASASFTFDVANAEALFRTGNAAFDNLAGPDTGVFDWGLPFFLGRSVFVGIEGQSTPVGSGPYWAY
jgi:hypothetical protein